MSPQTTSETEAIRSDIEMTRQRMDRTMDALTERLHGRHLLDEVIGFFRGSEDGSGTGASIREKITNSAGTATNTVLDTVKKNPLPLLLIGAGAAWLVYSATRDRSPDFEDSDDAEGYPYDPQTHLDLPLNQPEGSVPQTEISGEEEGISSRIYDASREAASEWNQRMSDVADRARMKMQAVRDRAAHTVDEHPLEIGLGCLAVGIVAGLAMPTPPPVRRYAGPAVDRLRHRVRDAGREILEKGKRVAEAAKSNASAGERPPGASATDAGTFPATNAPSPGEIARDDGKGPAPADVEPATGGNLRPGDKLVDPSTARPSM